MDEIINKVPDIIVGIVSGGTAGSIAKGVLALLVFVGLWFVNKWIEKKKNESAQRQTEEGRVRDQAGTVDDNQKITDAANKAEGEIKDIFKPKP